MVDGECELCSGRGWQIVETREGSRARRCECWSGGDEARRLERAGIPPWLRRCTLDGLIAENRSLETALSAVRSFVDDWPIRTTRTGLLLHGPVGTGKTHLAVAAVRELVLRWKAGAKFLDFRKLLKTIQESWNPISGTSEKQVLDDVLEVELLALDDLGAEKSSPWVRDTLGYLVNERYVNGRPLLITTNLPFGDRDEEEASRTRLGGVETLIDRIGASTLSRLHEMCSAIPIRGRDFRRKDS